MKQIKDKKLIFFGCPMDCDEKHDAIQDKLYGLWTTGKSDDPFDGVMEIIRKNSFLKEWAELGSIDVPAWLRPKPKGEDLVKVNTDDMIAFIDKDGCLEIAEKVKNFVSEKIVPDIPCMIGVDHSLTGGIVKALSQFHGKENFSLIVIDSHTDAIPMPVLSGAIQYDMETNSDSVHDPNDPHLFNRPDSYNASSFIHHLLTDEIIFPKNLYILGVSDYPEKKAFRINDPRIKSFTGVYTDLKQRGVNIMTKKECVMTPKKLKAVMNKVSTSHAYVSVDMDIGASIALEGVRFRNWKGLKEKKIYKVIDAVSTIFLRGVQFAGMDITEIDPRRAGEFYQSGKDQTYEIAANVIKMLCLEH